MIATIVNVIKLKMFLFLINMDVKLTKMQRQCWIVRFLVKYNPIALFQRFSSHVSPSALT